MAISDRLLQGQEARTLARENVRDKLTGVAATLEDPIKDWRDEVAVEGPNDLL